MHTMLLVGLIVLGGFVCGEIAQKIGLPKITGYILAGIGLNPHVLPIIPEDFTAHTDFVTNIALAFITFAVGGTIRRSHVRQMGKTIAFITVGEAGGALCAVIIGFTGVLLLHSPETSSWGTALLPLSIVLGALASPTDPSATLAVTHQYKAKGTVASTVMGVAAFDDALGIVNYSLGVAVAEMLLMHKELALYTAFFSALSSILGGIGVGVAFGWVLNRFISLLARETEGAYIVVLFALLALCAGVTNLLGLDALLATMSMGCVVANWNPNPEQLFQIMERYTDEMIFVLFFTLGGMHLNFAALSGAYGLIALFVVFRACGKYVGTFLGASMAHASPLIKTYTAFGLLPQGGIVIGLALTLKANPAFASIADTVISLIIGATVVHELIGPILAKIALQKAGELDTTCA